MMGGLCTKNNNVCLMTMNIHLLLNIKYYRELNKKGNA